MHALEMMGRGDERTEVIELATARDLGPDRAIELLRYLARLDGLFSSDDLILAARPWILAALNATLNTDLSPEDKLDRFEEVYALLGYPEQLHECSRYYVPEHDRLRGIRVGETTESPLVAMARVRARLATELGLK